MNKKTLTHDNQININKQKSIQDSITPAYHGRQNKANLPHFPVPLSLLLGEKKTPHGLWLTTRTKEWLRTAPSTYVNPHLLIQQGQS